MSALPRSLLPLTASVSPAGALSVGGVDVTALAESFGTPLFVYDEAHLRARAAETVAAFGDGAVYAAKAFLCLAMARLVHEEGMRIDVASGGELSVALRAGVPGGRLVFHGNNKSLSELRDALEAGVGRIVVDSFDELDRLEALHAEGLPVPSVLLRITPGIEAHTHEYVATGQDDSKFGFTVSTGMAAEAVDRARRSPAVSLVGIHAHIGSQIFRLDSFVEAVRAVAAFARPLDLPEVSFGGGLGVAYVTGESAPSITEWGDAVLGTARDEGLGAAISVEPGRAVAATAGMTLYTVGTIKRLDGIRTYVAVDGGMSDNPRPVLYGSGYEAFLPRRAAADRDLPVRLVGKHCESGDVLVRDGRLPSDVAVGDVVATPVTGAYGHSMASTYNKIPRAAVVFVSGGDARVVVERETYDDLIRLDRM